MVCWESRYQGWVQSRQKPQVSNIPTEKILLVRWCYGLKCPQRASLALLSRVTLKRNLCTPSMGDSQTLLPSLGSLSPPFSGPASPQMPCYLGAASCSMDTTAQGPPPPDHASGNQKQKQSPIFQGMSPADKTKQAHLPGRLFQTPTTCTGPKEEWSVARGTARSAGSHCCPWKGD